MDAMSGKKYGKFLFNKGKRALDDNTIGLVPFIKYDNAIQYFHRASLIFLVSSQHREASECLVECARIHSKYLKEERDAAFFLIQAAEIYLKVDKNESISLFKAALQRFCDMGDFTIAANLQFEVAEIHFGLRNMEDAAIAFRRSADLYAFLPDRSNYCLRMSATCYTAINEYKIAGDLFLLVAESYTQSNMQKFNCNEMLLSCIFCQIALSEEGDNSQKYAKILDFSINLEDVNFIWKGCKEAMFVRNLIKARIDCNIHDFADHMYHWNLARPLEMFQILILKTFIHKEIQAEIANKNALQKQARKEAEKKISHAERRRKKRLNKRADSDSDSDNGSNSDNASESTGSDSGSDDGGINDNGDNEDRINQSSGINELDEDDHNGEIPEELKDANKTDKKYEKKWK